MMLAKAGDWFKTNPQRGNSNNSVKCLRREITKAQFTRIVDKLKQWGEPGFFFADDVNTGANPCCEICMFPFLREDGKLLSGWSFCNLVEINGGMVKTRKATASIFGCQA
jgi:ribonucleoside-diphosphate reductase alpha chain